MKRKIQFEILLYGAVCRYSTPEEISYSSIYSYIVGLSYAYENVLHNTLCNMLLGIGGSGY